jgi:DNA polymerase/3'-5' exonuclease PolX
MPFARGQTMEANTSGSTTDDVIDFLVPLQQNGHPFASYAVRTDTDVSFGRTVELCMRLTEVASSPSPKNAAAADTSRKNEASTLARRTLGRVDFLPALWAACGCNTSPNRDTSVPQSYHYRTSQDKCDACQRVHHWAMRFLPRRFLYFARLNDSGDYEFAVIPGKSERSYPGLECVTINEIPLKNLPRYPRRGLELESNNENTALVGWWRISAGDTLSLLPPPSLFHKNGIIEVNDNESDKAENKTQLVLLEPLRLQLIRGAAFAVYENKAVGELRMRDTPTSKTNGPRLSFTTDGASLDHTVLETEEVQRDIEQYQPERLQNDGESNENIPHALDLSWRKPSTKNDVTQESLCSASKNSRAHDGNDKRDPSRMEEGLQVFSSVPKGPSHPPEYLQPISRATQGIRELSPPIALPGQPIKDPSIDSKHSENRKRRLILYFVEKGLDMNKTLLNGSGPIQGLKHHVQQRGAEVLSSFDKNIPPWPTHFVVSEQVQEPLSIAQALGFDSLEEMSSFLYDHSIVCATRRWVHRGDRLDKPPLEEPTMMETYLGIGPKRKCKRHRTNKNEESNDSQSSRSNVYKTNQSLSEAFRTLSKRHQEMPLNGELDAWKSYSFQITAGRLLHLGFEIRDSPEVLRHLASINGFGSSTMDIITDYLRTQQCSRLRNLESDPDRIAMKNMMNIWGVGRLRAKELVDAGFKRINEVRQAVELGNLQLERNQYIGVLCYDDLLEKMDRTEVESIGKIISNIFKMSYPEAEVCVMGSYRRGKHACGDVDILITHEDYNHTVPPKALGQFIDELRQQGHIAYHLTFISGMKHELYETIPDAPSHWSPQRDKRDKSSSSSYMGVFKSPCMTGKKRRVDIKFYPWREKAFASLYFTGNGYFNRSMRLWATRKFNYTLNDHGVFDRGSLVRVLDTTSEKEIFEFLDISWREPTERDSFDAVKGKKNGESAAQLEGFSRSEVSRESRDHRWIV